jgi:hypothetical protein
MIAVAFVMFALLFVAWLLAPNGEVEEAAQPVGNLNLAESPA